MKLSEYMADRGLDDATMTEKIGSCSESALRKWKYGERIPRPRTMARIEEVTAGSVTLSDWTSQPQPNEAA